VADKRAEAAHIAQALEEQGQKVSVLAEDLDQARQRADDVAARARAAEEKLRETDRRVSDARSRLRGHAVASYVKGGELPAMQAMVAGTSDDLAVRTVYVKEVAGQQQVALEDLRAARQARAAATVAAPSAAPGRPQAPRRPAAIPVLDLAPAPGGGGGTMVEASQTGTPVRYASIFRRDMAGVGRVG
jgi:hypothetical protein